MTKRSLHFDDSSTTMHLNKSVTREDSRGQGLRNEALLPWLSVNSHPSLLIVPKYYLLSDI